MSEVASYLLDTNACIALINHEPPQVRLRFKRAIKQGDIAAVSAVVVFELWYGVAKSARKDASAERLKSFLAGPVELAPFEVEDARVAGEIRATLEAVGTPIGPYDIQIAGQALRLGATLVTANTSEFSRVDGLRWENWSSPQ